MGSSTNGDRPFPRGVVVNFRDGSFKAAEMRYSHTDEDGIRHFVTTEVFDLSRVAGATCEFLPGKTSIGIRAE